MAPVPGLTFVPAYITADEASALCAAVDAAVWMTDLTRRVQHYGWRYDYRARAIDETLYLGPLPGWAACIAARLRRDGYVTAIPDQLIVTLPSQ